MDMLSINVNPSLLGIQNKLNTSNNILNASLQKVSADKCINQTDNDVAGYYDSRSVNSQIRILKQAQNNITIGSSILSTAENVMNNIAEDLNRINDLAIQGTDPTLTYSERNTLNKEANALVEDIKKQNTDTTFNGINVFGSISTTNSISSVSTNTIPPNYTAIYTAEDLNNVRNNLSGKYILMNDIDLSSVNNWEPIGTSGTDTQFSGVFDGNGYVIKNLTINKTDTSFVGLFGATMNTGTEIKNLGLENVDIKGKESVGGLVGNNGNATITNCYVVGNVSGNTTVGGLVGNNVIGTISNCFATGSVSGSNDTVGGLAGNNVGKITNCYSSCDISGNNNVGGLVGYNFSRINNCYTTSNTSGNNNTGLICGRTANTSNVENTWADKKDSTLSAIDFAEGTITNSIAVEHSEFASHEFWDKQGLDSEVWELSCSIPPVLKGVGKNNNNWYFERGNNEKCIKTGEDNTSQSNSVTINTGLDLGAMNIDLSTVEGCHNASVCAQAAIGTISKKTTDIELSQSSLGNAALINSAKIENLTSAYTNITDTNIAEKSANYTKAEIMVNTTAALIVQTQNFQPAMLLNMLNDLR